MVDSMGKTVGVETSELAGAHPMEVVMLMEVPSRIPDLWHSPATTQDAKRARLGRAYWLGRGTREIAPRAALI
jgi:hypothetical protein